MPPYSTMIRVSLCRKKKQRKKIMAKRILVINDTQEILELFRILFEEEGYEVILSGVPLQKVADVEQIHPNLIVLDIIFRQEKNGWQMLEMLRMNRTTAYIPIVICTAALKDVQEQEGYLNNQGIRIVYKPFDIDVLLDIVKIALETASQSGSSQKDQA
jgi:DNA-binding response OmpR family regulator